MGLILSMDFLRLISPGEFGVFSHVGGYLAGMFYYFSIYGFFNFKTKFKTHTKPKMKYRTSKQSKIDKILDKISKSGYDSLSKVEKEFLFKQGGKK